MSHRDLLQKLLDSPGYLKSGIPKLMELFGVSKKVAKRCVREAKEKLTPSSRPKFKRLFFDIETSPNIMYSWRAGFKLNLGHGNIIKERAIICICWKWEGEEKTHYLTWSDTQCDKVMLELFIDVIKEADEVIGHNGDRFDIPWLRTRAIIHGLEFPTYIKSLDTLKKARKGGFNFNSNRLDYLAKILLGEGKMDTGGFSLWTSIIEDKNPESMAKMVKYCKKDVVLLERVFHKLSNYIKPNTHVGMALTGIKECCTSCGSTEHNHIKEVITVAGTIQHLLQCSNCNAHYKVSVTTYKKMI